MSQPIVLTKVSVTYSSTEDRMRMTGRIGEGDARVFWLTQRICHKLVKAIGHFIEKASSIPSGSDRDLVLSFQQSAAMVRKESSDPVVAGSAAQSSLVERIDITHRKETVQLNFFIAGGGSAQLSLTVQSARQWLGILHAQYQQAAWFLDIWPTWIVGAMDKPGASGVGRNIH